MRATERPRPLDEQNDWHTTFRDQNINHYRTSYLDMIGQREVCCKSDKPSGYGGHVAAVGADILFHNTQFHATQQALQEDEERERLPTYEYQLNGLPTVCQNPRGARTQPKHKTIPNGYVVPPWAIEDEPNPLSYRQDMTRYLNQMAAPRYRTVMVKKPTADMKAGDALCMIQNAHLHGGDVQIEAAPAKQPTPPPVAASPLPMASVAQPATTPRSYTPRPPSARFERATEKEPPRAIEATAAKAMKIPIAKASYSLQDMKTMMRTPRSTLPFQSGALTAR